MPDDRCRITVIGDRHQADVAVPAYAPIGEFTPRLAQICGQQANDALPAVWSLAPAGAGAVPLTQSLSEAGILDGQRLYLHDLAAGEADEPVVSDVTELIADHQGNRGRLTVKVRAVTAVVLGLGWLLAAIGYLLFHRSALDKTGAAGWLTAAGLVLPAVAWVLRRRPAPAPQLLCVAVALSAVPCLAGAGALLSSSHTAMGISVACGANLGALIAMAAVPDGITMIVSGLLVVATITGAVLAAVHAGHAASAAVVTLVASITVAAAPWAAATITGTPLCTPRDISLHADAVADMLATTLRLLGVLTTVPAAALVAALAVLARSHGVFALALVAVASVALIARAADAVFTAQAIPLGTAGLAGLLITCTRILAYVPSALGWAALLLIPAGIGIVIAGAGLVAASALPQRNDSQVMTPDRRSFCDVVRLACNLALTPLALGVFSVFHQLVRLGGHA